MKRFFRFFRELWKAPAFSPTAFVIRAIIITVFFSISELLGLREYTTFLSGTSANVNLSWQTASLLGLIHLFLYVASRAHRCLEPLERLKHSAANSPSSSGATCL